MSLALFSIDSDCVTKNVMWGFVIMQRPRGLKAMGSVDGESD